MGAFVGGGRLAPGAYGPRARGGRSPAGRRLLAVGPAALLRAVGALAGGAIGNYMDRQEAAMREALSDTGVGVRREGNDLRLIMPGDVTFATNSSDIQGQFYGILNDVSTVLNRYPATYIDVVGHADSTGPDAYNQTLSENRAISVGNYLIAQGVLRDRFYIAGMGERAPIASNDTAYGRQQNRRVEILIRPHAAS